MRADPVNFTKKNILHARVLQHFPHNTAITTNHKHLSQIQVACKWNMYDHLLVPALHSTLIPDHTQLTVEG